MMNDTDEIETFAPYLYSWACIQHDAHASWMKPSSENRKDVKRNYPTVDLPKVEHNSLARNYKLGRHSSQTFYIQSVQSLARIIIQGHLSLNPSDDTYHG